MTTIKRWMNHVNWDRWGMSLSLLCAVHCVMTPLALLSLPMIARYLLLSPYFHVLMAILILPVGVYSFYVGYGHHHRRIVLWLGVPGLFLICFAPMVAHELERPADETPWMILGSFMLVAAHWINRRKCEKCDAHLHE
jgi:hypothetical protein